MTGTEFKLRRKMLGLTLVDLAGLIGVTHAAISMWETGKNPIPRMAQLALNYLDCTRPTPAVVEARAFPESRPQPGRIPPPADELKTLESWLRYHPRKYLAVQIRASGERGLAPVMVDSIEDAPHSILCVRSSADAERVRSSGKVPVVFAAEETRKSLAR